MISKLVAGIGNVVRVYVEFVQTGSDTPILETSLGSLTAIPALIASGSLAFINGISHG
ncbi:hypothetical protein [Rhodococcus sp. IEGM 1379]|uniref:hypothetical protein n=1 Tax=Rhodococcus sp. IEGM 1379 TaxID=3047086 RepID=UPI0024B7F2F0|nr:hypothetical protein [Rhodococcus sp. IEGM 1379]MDI9915105.1 hypothetical protein [Rhodococcus sp. IEGM 1379]